MSEFAGKVIIYGGRGALGNTLIKHFKAKNFWVLSIDLSVNDTADTSIVLEREDTWAKQAERVMTGLETHLGEEGSKGKVDAIINVAGGWAGGNCANVDFLKSCEMMWSQSVWSSGITATAASKFLKPGGLITLPGAAPAVAGTPGMIGYGMAKAAVHQLTKSLAMDKSGVPSGTTTVALLPVTLDTPMNRKWMAKEDQTKWTPLEFVAELFHKWTLAEERPPTGSLVKLVTKDSKTELVLE